MASYVFLGRNSATGSANNIALTTLAAVAAGDLVIVRGTQGSTTVNPPGMGITDPTAGANTWQKAIDFADGTGDYTTIWYSIITTGFASGSTLTRVWTTASTFRSIDAIVVRAVDAPFPVVSIIDTGCTTGNAATSAALTSSATTHTPTTSNWVAVTCAAYNVSSVAPQAGWTEDSDLSNVGFESQTIIGTNTTAMRGQGTGNTSGLWMMTCAMFKLGFSGGGTTPQTLSASAPTSALDQFSVLKISSCTASCVASMLRQTAVLLTALLTNICSRILVVKKIISTSASTSATVQAIKIVLLSLSAICTSVSTSLHAVGVTISSSTVNTATSSIRNVRLSISATGGNTISLTKRGLKLLNLTVSQSASLATLKVVLLTLSATASSIVSSIRFLRLLLVSFATDTVTVVLQGRKSLNTTSVTSAIINAFKVGGTVFPQALSATSAVAASMSLRVSKLLSSSSSNTASSLRSVQKLIPSSVVSIALRTSRLTKTLSGPVASQVSLLKGARRTISASCTSVATVTRSFVRKVTLSASVVTTAVVAGIAVLIGPVIRGIKAFLTRHMDRLTDLPVQKSRESVLDNVRMTSTDLDELRSRETALDEQGLPRTFLDE